MIKYYHYNSVRIDYASHRNSIRSSIRIRSSTASNVDLIATADGADMEVADGADKEDDTDDIDHVFNYDLDLMSTYEGAKDQKDSISFSLWDYGGQ